jgi:hypothetical protein
LGTVGWIGSDQAVMPPAAFQIMLKPFSSQCATALVLQPPSLQWTTNGLSLGSSAVRRSRLAGENDSGQTLLDAEGLARLSLTCTTLLPEAEVTENYDAVTGQRIGWALHLGETPVHEVGYGYTGTGLLGTVTLKEAGVPVANWAHDYAPAMARVARVQGRLGVAGPVHTATSFFDEHLRVE